MTFPTDDILLGPAAFGPRKGTEGIVWHTTEAADASRASAVGTRNWQLANPGSYNWIIYDGGLLLTVPYLEASGGVNPASPAWAPSRYPFLRQNLSPAAYADPNAYLLNVAFSGKTAVFRDQGMPANMLDTAVRLTKWLEAQPWTRKPLLHCGHMHWQSNRSDPSQAVLDRIESLYRGIPDTSTEDDMDWVKAIKIQNPPEQVTFRAETSYRRRPDLTPESSPVVLGYADTRTVIGNVNGEDFGAGPLWLVMVSNNGGLIVVHSQDVVSRKPLTAGIDPSKYDALKQTAASLLEQHAAGLTAAAAKVRETNP